MFFNDIINIEGLKRSNLFKLLSRSLQAGSLLQTFDANGVLSTAVVEKVWTRLGEGPTYLKIYFDTGPKRGKSDVIFDFDLEEGAK